MVEYMNHMGTDDTVCDAARVSMDKAAILFTKEQNKRLLVYLAKNQHWSPFSHTSLQMRFEAPIFVARQLAKHQVGFAWNEVSRRYVSSDPICWYPEFFRMRPENIKQGSGLDPHPRTSMHKAAYSAVCHTALKAYKQMVDDGICPEQARAVLPQSMMTQWIWTGSLYAWHRMYKLRIDTHAQAEVQIYARKVANICRHNYPDAWSALEAS